MGVITASPTSTTTTDGPPMSGRRFSKNVPLLAIAPSVAAARDGYFASREEQGEDEEEVRDVWHVIAKASALVKDGQRLENLAWRNWSQQRHHASSALQCDTSRRRCSFGSTTTGSSASLYTPGIDVPPSPTTSTGSRSERVTFNDALKRLMPDNEFTDWVGDAQKKQAQGGLSPPILSVPDTPIANVEIRLVEPTPVPSRVGSLGGSISASGFLGVAAVPPRLKEEPEAEEIEEEEEEDVEGDEQESAVNMPAKAKPTPRSPKKRGKFFVHSSPSKGSGSDSAVSPSALKSPSVSPTIASDVTQVSAPVVPPSPSLSSGSRASQPPIRHPRRQSSASSTGNPVPAVAKKRSPKSPEKKRHVSLSTMRGRFTAEKRRAAEVIERKAEEAQAAQEAAEAEVAAVAAARVPTPAQEVEVDDAAQQEESGWEDEDEEEDEADWSDDDNDKEDEEEGKGKENTSPPKTTKASPARPDNRRRSSSKSGNSSSALDLTGLFRSTSRRSSNGRAPPPPPAPTPLRNMSRAERLAAKEERRRIELELEAQQKREMFAKQQIFGTQKPAQTGGLLSGMFKRGGSMVNLNEQTAAPPSPPLKPCPTHGHLPSLVSASRSPNAHAGPSLLRSKSAVAMPVQTGISVTRISPRRSRLSEEIGSGGSAEAAAAGASANSPETLEVVKRPSRPAHRPSDRSVKTDRTSSKERNIPEDVELESDSSSEEEDSYLATSSTRQKLAQLAQKASAKKTGKMPALSASPSELPLANPLYMATAAPLALPNPVFARANGSSSQFVMGMTPTTQRREIIKREMSESLRMNLMLERAKSSGGQKRDSSGGLPNHSRPKPSTHTSLLPARHSSANLANHPVLARHKSEVSLSTQDSQATTRNPSPSPTLPALPAAPQPHEQPGTSELRARERDYVSPPPVEPARRRTQPNVLGGYLRPLTRVGTDAVHLGRAQSSANLVSTRTAAEEHAVVHQNMGAGSSTRPRGEFVSGAGMIMPVAGAGASGSNLEAPAMVRRSTEGSPNANWKDDIERRRELMRRSVAQDNGYRTHGW